MGRARIRVRAAVKIGNFVPRPDMADDKHTPLNELAARIAEGIKRLDEGALDLDALGALCDDVRDLDERLVVLRHRAREERVRAPEKPTQAEATNGRPEPLPVDPRQMNIIQAIETEKKVPPAANAPSVAAGSAPETKSKRSGREPAFKLVPPPATTAAGAPPKTPATAKPTLADKLEHAPIKDLAKAIVISQKFWFINGLFGKDASAYDRAIKRMNAAGGLEEARTILRMEAEEHAKKPDEEALTALMDLLQRRFK